MSKSALIAIAAAGLMLPGAAMAQYVAPQYGPSVYTGYGYGAGAYSGGQQQQQQQQGAYGQGGYQQASGSGSGYGSYYGQAPYQGGYNQGGYRHAGYPVSVNGYDSCRRDNGLGGAALGAVIGGVAGNRIAGKGDRLEGTLIGAGIGGLAGLAIDKAEDDPCYNYMPKQYRDAYYRDDRGSNYGRVPNGYGPYNATGGYYGGNYPQPERSDGYDYRRSSGRDSYGYDSSYAYGYGQPYGYGPGYPPAGYVPSVAGYWVYGAGAGGGGSTVTTVVVNAGSSTTVTEEVITEYSSSGGVYYVDDGYYYETGGPQAARRATKERSYHTKGK